MTASGTLLVKHHRSSTYNNIKSSSSSSSSHQLLKRHRRQTILLTPRRCFSSIAPIDNNIMSAALIRELDLKMQQVKEYGLIAHGYHNENIQYPVHVRRSHDGEKLPRSLPLFDKQHRTNRLMNTTVLTSSSHENQTSLSKRRNLSKRQQTSNEQQQRTFIVPPNKTVNDIDPCISRDHSYTTGKSLTRFCYHRKSSSSSTNSSPILCSLRPHSIACLSTTETITTESCESTKTSITDESQLNPLDNSSQTLIHPTTSRTPIRTITQKFFSKLFHNPSKS